MNDNINETLNVLLDNGTEKEINEFIDNMNDNKNETLNDLLDNGTEKEITEFIDNMNDNKTTSLEILKRSFVKKKLLAELNIKAYEEITPMIYSCPSVYINIIINGRIYKALIDTGCEKSVMVYNIIKECNLNECLDTSYKSIFYGVNGVPVNSKGIIDYIKIKIENIEYSCNFTVIKKIHKNQIILGMNFLMFYKAKMDFENNLLILGENYIPLIYNDH